MSNRQLEIDHKWPVSRNGGNELSNLQLLCTACNLRKGIQTDEEFRDRYWRLLPPDGTIPDPPIGQDEFTKQTQYTRASPTVRGIYRNRFEAARRRRILEGYERSRGDPVEIPAGFLLVGIAIVILLIVIASQCGG